MGLNAAKLHLSDDAATVGEVVGVLMGIGAVVGGVGAAGYAVWRSAGDRRAAYTEAVEACLRPALLTRELGLEDPEVERSLQGLAFRYYRQREFTNAEPLYRRALAIQEASLGANAPEVATILLDYAALLRQADRVNDALELEARAAATW